MNIAVRLLRCLFLVHADSKCASTAIAKTDCKLAIMERKNFLFAVQQTPMFALEIMRSYSDRIRRLRESVTSE
nr:Crp/Fnr family transcriptional regulator [Pleurocapsa sp. CCALA 161]